MKTFPKLVVAAIGLIGASAASAALLTNAVGLQAVDATSTSNYGAPYTTARTIDQSDLSGSYVSGVTSTSVIDTFTNLNQGNGWHGAFNDTQGSITFDLGAQYTLDRVYLFWMNGGGGNNIADFSILVSDDAAFSAPTLAASFGFPTAGQDRVDFASLATGEFVRLEWTNLQGSYPGLNEFIAGGVAAMEQFPSQVPEPATAALIGLGLLGCFVSRRRPS